jgi:hypothetical protein
MVLSGRWGIILRLYAPRASPRTKAVMKPPMTVSQMKI